LRGDCCVRKNEIIRIAKVGGVMLFRFSLLSRLFVWRRYMKVCSETVIFARYCPELESSSCRRGRIMLTVVPRFSVDTNEMLPLCRSAIFLAIKRPSPVPSVRCRRAFSAR